jgi:hypothetical protein
MLCVSVMLRILIFLRKYFIFIDAQIKNFYYINPRECIEDIDCISKILNIHREVFSLTTRRKYIIK